MNKKTRRVAITGLGAIHALGTNPESLFNAVTAGRSGISVLDDSELSKFPTKKAARVLKFPMSDILDSKEIRHWDRYIQFGVYAALQAWKSAGFKLGSEDCRTGVWLGSGIGGIETLVKAQNGIVGNESWRSSPFTIPMMLTNMAAGIVSMKVGAKGPCLAPVTACATGNNAIGEAFTAIREGIVDRAVCGGAEAPLSPIAFSGFNSMRAMSTKDGGGNCQPFSIERDGFLMGEGSGVLVIEDWESAMNRGAEIFAEVKGYGSTADAYHFTSPDPEGHGAARAMRSAMDQAGWNPEQVDYINAHGTGTPLGDIAETKAIRKSLGLYSQNVMVSSTKGATGHLFGAAGGIEAVIAVKTLQSGVVPPTLGLENTDPECDLDYVPCTARNTDPVRLLSNGFGFGGHNAVIALEKV